MTEHTALPWSLDDDGDTIYIWADAVKDYVALATDFSWGAPHKANAAFIVKAVNNHDALMQALMDALCELSACATQMGCREGGSVHRAQEAARRTLAAVSSPSNPEAK